MDASSADGYLNVLSPNLYAEQARIIQKGAPGQWVNLQKVGEARTQVSIQATLSPDGELKGERTVLYQGNAAAEERHAFRTATDSAAFVTEKAERNGYEITALQMTGHREFGPSVRETIAFTRRADATADHIYFSPFTGTPITSNPFRGAGAEVARGVPLPSELQHDHPADPARRLADRGDAQETEGDHRR